MKLFRRTRWKPKQKLRKADIQFLLTEYRIEKSRFYASISWSAAFFSIGVVALIATATTPDDVLEAIVGLCLTGGLILALNGNLHRSKASRIREVLGIEKRLERYGVEED